MCLNSKRKYGVFMHHPILIEIGRTSLGKVVKIQIGLDFDALNLFVEKFSLEEQTDIFCLTEYLSRRFESRGDISMESKMIRDVFTIGFRKFKTGLYQNFLTSKGLFTSISRVAYGKSLSHVAYRD